MFKIEAFVEDKRLGDALRALAGIVRGQPSVVPVVNVIGGKGGQPKAATNGSLVSMFEQHIIDGKMGNLKPADIRNWLAKMGKSKSSMTYLANMAIEHKLLRRVGKGNMTSYNVVQKKG